MTARPAARWVALGGLVVAATALALRLGRATSFYFAYGTERSVAASPNAPFEKFKAGDYHAYFTDVVCGGDVGIGGDVPSRGRAQDEDHTMLGSLS